MKKLSVAFLTAFVVLITATFGYTESMFVAQGYAFPFFQLGALILGGMILVSLKQKYSGLFLSEAIGSFALYTIMISLFTNPVIDAVKTLVM